MARALVYGVAIAGAATLRGLVQRGFDVIAVDDAVTGDKVDVANEFGIELVSSPDTTTIERLVRDCDFVAPSPGVPEKHAVVKSALAIGRPLRTEIDLAYEWEQQRRGGARPMLAVTGTDGKTTTTLLATEMLLAAGLRAVPVGNTDVPLIEAIDDEALEVFVVECSSFRLSWTTCFRAEAAAWLNFAPDHLNWHRDMASYEAAKARLWIHQHPDDVAIGFGTDAVINRRLAEVRGRRLTFGLSGADYHCVSLSAKGGTLVGPRGPLCSVADMRRSLPHDITNALAAAALVQQSGLGDTAAIASALGSFVGPPHRIELVAQVHDVNWYNDSKATTPHASLTAIRAFESVVLIAGGRNKGLDLASMASVPTHMRGVVAIGESADIIEAAFTGVCQVRRADSMREAVAAAGSMAQPGDAVVLSPGCASFDWYPDGGYPARGDDYRACVRAYLGQSPPDGNQSGRIQPDHDVGRTPVVVNAGNKGTST
jgi:UDP-N-acetylmuramoylalanine--D-glutamate ligase